MLNYDLFVEKYYPSPAKSQVSDISRFFNRLNKVIPDGDFEEKLKDKEIVCSLFYLQRLNAITRTHYQKIKAYLVNLYDWLGVDGLIPSHEEVIKSGEHICFFKDLNSALSFIDDVGKAKLRDYNPLSDLVTVKTIFILGWTGLTLSEIVGLKKVDLSKNDDGCFVSLPDRKIKIDECYYSIIEALRDLDEYKSLPKGKIKVFKGRKEYMFRPTSGEGEHTTEDLIVQILKRFNRQIPIGCNQNIAFRYIHTNALFIEIYNDKSDAPLIKKIEVITGCSPKQAFSYRTQYLAWLQMVKCR